MGLHFVKLCMCIMLSSTTFGLLLNTPLFFYLRSRQISSNIGRFLPARRYASAGNSDHNVSVRPSVRHAPVLCQNEER